MVLQLAKSVLVPVNRYRMSQVNGHISLIPNSSEGNLAIEQDRNKERYGDTEK